MDSAEVPDRLITVRRVLAWVLIAQVLVLAVTGLYLVFGYHPTPTESWGVLTLDDPSFRGRTFADSVRTAHRWAAWSTLLPATVLAAVAFSESMMRWKGRARRRSGVVTGPAILLVVVVALLTGFALPWDQVALRAVTVGTSYRGYEWLLGDDVRFVLIGGAEVSVAMLRAVFAVHALLVPPLLAVALGVTARRGRRHPVDHTILG